MQIKFTKVKKVNKNHKKVMKTNDQWQAVIYEGENYKKNRTKKVCLRKL